MLGLVSSEPELDIVVARTLRLVFPQLHIRKMIIARLIFIACVASTWKCSVVGFLGEFRVSDVLVHRAKTFVSMSTETPKRLAGVAREEYTNLPLWLSGRDRSPPNWLISEDLPSWFHEKEPPGWMHKKDHRPPKWMLGDMIPSVILNSYTTGCPPLWMLNMDKLPAWFSEVDVLPDWLLAFNHDPPPSWMVEDVIPGFLMRSETSALMKFDNVHANFPILIQRGGSELIRQIEEQEMAVLVAATDDLDPDQHFIQSSTCYRNAAMKSALIQYEKLYGGKIIPESALWPQGMWGMELGHLYHLLNKAVTDPLFLLKSGVDSYLGKNIAPSHPVVEEIFSNEYDWGYDGNGFVHDNCDHYN